MESEPNTGNSADFLQKIRLIVDTIPTLAWSAESDGSADFFNQGWLEYTGLTLDQAWLPQAVESKDQNMDEERQMIEAALAESRGRVPDQTEPRPNLESHLPLWIPA